ncbi:hypothetical protein DFH29DRAFT_132507 [Suillus ampliporus]|nr:hypothetical protein DFH29DRAFT_132507 [Suillus ampliporus]
MLRVARRLFRPTIAPSSLEGQYIRLEVISGKNLNVPSERIPAGIYISIKVGSRRRWNSAVRVLSSDSSVAWGHTVTLSLDGSTRLLLEIRASFELRQILGQGELIGTLEMSLNELLDHGDQPFDVSFPSIGDICPSLTLKVAFVHTCGHDDNTPLDSIVECAIARRTDAGHVQFRKYVTGKHTFHLKRAVKHIQWVLDQCPIGHPDHAAALTNLAFAWLQGFICKDLQYIDSTTSLFCDTLALSLQGHPDHPSSLYHLTEALNWHHNNQHTSADICESAQLYHELLPLCPEGTYLRSIVAEKNGVDYVIDACNNILTDRSDEGLQLRRIVVELCPSGHQHCLRALAKLLLSLHTHFTQCGGIDDIDKSMQCCCEVVSLAPEGHPDHGAYLNNLSFYIALCFDQQGKSHDIDEAISLYDEVLRLCIAEHEYCDAGLLNNLGGALHTRFEKCGDINDLNKAIILFREALTLRPPGHPTRDTTLNNLALTLTTRYSKLPARDSEDLNEAIDLYRESLRLTRLDDPERHMTLF